MVSFIRGADQPKRAFFATLGRSSEQLTDTPLSRRNALDMVKRRARHAGVKTTICNHSFRGTGITTYLENGGELEKAAAQLSIDALLLPWASIFHTFWSHQPCIDDQL